ncbi:energy-coupling factor transporter transmembrane protein EcfT [Candidatus Woesearchaeota archaeon]|nr:energy-coupling factor transporter transmembrane protein EcfT [Candidatus Woesearchaeota archaeon]
MLRRFTFGQYKDRNSVIHSLDARIKMIYVIVFGILSFAIKSKSGILIFSLFVLSLIVLSKMSLSELIRNLMPFYFIFVFLLLMYILFSRNQLVLGVIYIWRFLMLIIISLLLTYTTTIQNLIVAIEKLSKPLKIFSIKPRNIAVMVSVAVRFVPVMFIRFDKTRESMLARLADLRKIKHIKLLVMVVLEKMFGSASNLSDALQSRLYNENLANKKILRFNKYDYLSIVFILILIVIIY